MSSYATPTDFVTYGLPAAATAGFTTPQIQAALDAASTTCDGYINNSFALPLVSWDVDLRRAVCQIAAYDLMGTRGYNPDAGADDTLRLRADASMKWLRDIGEKRITPPTWVDSRPNPQQTSSGPFVMSRPPRGWGGPGPIGGGL